MSKIGKINITIPEKVKLVLNDDNVNIEGPLGKKNLKIDSKIFDLNINDSKEISIKPKIIDQDSKRLWGMNRSLIEKILELTGVGYRAAIKGKHLNLQLGFSHDINFEIPEGIKLTVEKQTIIKIIGTDKQQVGMIASKIKSFRPPEPYKGKGIKEQGQYVLRKEGKKK